MNFGQIAADPRADLDIFLGGELPGELVPFDKLALDRLADRNHRRRGGCVRRENPCRIAGRDEEDERRQPQYDCSRVWCHRTLTSRV